MPGLVFIYAVWKRFNGMMLARRSDYICGHVIAPNVPHVVMWCIFQTEYVVLYLVSGVPKQQTTIRQQAGRVRDYLFAVGLPWMAWIGFSTAQPCFYARERSAVAEAPPLLRFMLLFLLLFKQHPLLPWPDMPPTHIRKPRWHTEGNY